MKDQVKVDGIIHTYINIGEESFTEKDMDQEELLKRMDTDDTTMWPKTSQPSVGDFVEHYEKLKNLEIQNKENKISETKENKETRPIGMFSTRLPRPCTTTQLEVVAPHICMDTPSSNYSRTAQDCSVGRPLRSRWCVPLSHG